MNTLTEVGVGAGLVGIEALVAASIIVPGALIRRLSRILRSAMDGAQAAAGKARDRVRGFLRPPGPKFRPPRFA
jgi:hypothetical protein